MDKKAEAIKRMKKLDLMPEIIKDFEKNTRVYYSAHPGILYWLDNEPYWEDKVKEFEQEYNALVYHCIFTPTKFGNMLSMLYVSNHEDEWEMDNNDLDDGYVYAYVYNISYPELSEIGSICLKPNMGGVVRTA